MKLQHPILIIGGGPAGSSCALQLARLGHEVMLVDRSAGTRPRLGETCGPGVMQLLDRACNLSVPDSLYRPLDNFFCAWNSAELDARSFKFWQVDQGLVLNRNAFDKWLLDSAKQSGVNVTSGITITGGKWTSDGWTISTGSGTLQASYVVEAIGSRVRSVIQPGIGRIFTDMLVCLSVELPKHPTLAEQVMVESCEEGWWYLVQLPNRRLIVNFFTDAGAIGPAKNRLVWLNSILEKTSHIRRVAGELPNDSNVHICDARTSIRKVLWREGWIAIGDAAWCLDPLSGLGIQRAITDGTEAATLISRALTSGSPEGLKAHAFSQANSFNQSLVTQQRYYGSETRWRNSAFWRDR